MSNPFFSDFLYNSLPQIYRYLDKDKRELQRFLKIFGEALDLMYRDIEILPYLRDFDKCPDEYLPYLCEMLGVVYEPSIPHEYQRRFLKNHVFLKRQKGTETPIKYLAKELAGSEAEIEIIGDEISVYIIKAKDSDDKVVNSKVERRHIENYLKYYIPVMMDLIVYLYFGSTPTKIEITERTYDFGVPYKICNRFITDEVQGGLLKGNIGIKEKIYGFDTLYPICNTFVTSTINVEKSENNVILAKEYRDNEVLFKRVGSTFIGEGEI